VTMGFERTIDFMPAFDGRPGGPPEWRRPNMKPDDGTPHTDYGIGGVSIRFSLRGPLGGVTFSLLTDWYPPHVQRNGSHHEDVRPTGAGVEYHSPVPHFEGQEARRGPGKCDMVPAGQSCFSDGSTLLADEWVTNILLPRGSAGVWAEMEKWYHKQFQPEEAATAAKK